MVLEQPASDFWSTPPRHFWWLLEAKKDEAERIKGKPKGAEFKAGEVRALRKWMDAHNAAST